MTSVWWLRWIVVALGVAIGLVLIDRGAVLIGVLVLAAAVARALLLLTIRRRRATFWARRGRPGP